MKSIKVGGITYNIEYKDIEDFGKTEFNKNLITIDSKMNEQQQDVCLLHELLHCINNQLSEKDVEFLAQSIYQIITDNNMKSVIQRLAEGKKMAKSVSKFDKQGVKAPKFPTGMPKPNKIKQKIKDIKNKFKY